MTCETIEQEIIYCNQIIYYNHVRTLRKCYVDIPVPRFDGNYPTQRGSMTFEGNSDLPAENGFLFFVLFLWSIYTSTRQRRTHPHSPGLLVLEAALPCFFLFFFAFSHFFLLPLCFITLALLLSPFFLLYRCTSVTPSCFRTIVLLVFFF